MANTQAAIDASNSVFWNELCGTYLADRLGIRERTRESLAKFDEAFFAFYPYFLPLLQPERMRHKQVLEIGLGYGTVGQLLAELGANYTGLDIAAGPVEQLRARFQLAGLPGRVVQGSALDMPFPDASFDYIVSIGCFHHTGNVQRCFEETYRALRPGGIAVVMVYNRYSFRQWRYWPWQTLRSYLFGLVGKTTKLRSRQRAQYDANCAGDAAPETVLLSVRELRRMLSQFESVSFSKQNAEELTFRNWVLLKRKTMMIRPLTSWLGLDLYIEARKAS